MQQVPSPKNFPRHNITLSKMIIAVDFDGTIVEHKYPKIGKEIPFAVETLKRLQADNHTLILWSVREGQLLKDAVDWCRGAAWSSMP